MINEYEKNSYNTSFHDDEIENYDLIFVSEKNIVESVMSVMEGRYSYAKNLLSNLIGINSKTNPKTGELAKEISIAIKQEKYINQDMRQISLMEILFICCIRWMMYSDRLSSIGTMLFFIIREKPECIMSKKALIWIW